MHINQLLLRMKFMAKLFLLFFYVFLQGCSCEEVLTRMFMWRSTYKDVHVKKYLQGCSCEEVLTRMFMWRSSYKDVHVKKYLQGCSCEEVLTRMFMWRSTYKDVHGKKYLQGCSCEEVVTRMFMWRSTNMFLLVFTYPTSTLMSQFNKYGHFSSLRIGNACFPVEIPVKCMGVSDLKEF